MKPMFKQITARGLKSLTRHFKPYGVSRIPSTTNGCLSSNASHPSRFASTSVDKIEPLRSGDEARYTSVKTKFTSVMEVRDPNPAGTLPTYRVMDEQGNFLDKSYKLKLTQDRLLEMYKMMVTTSVMDHVLYDAQRQGRISFYMTGFGEEATHIGSAEALTLDDVIFLQYREAGVLLWRGFTLRMACDQCFSNMNDLGKGRQMPVHYGSRELNCQTISSPLTTQVPQASGAAYALKRSKKDAIVVCYFGEGAASEGDFHAAMNFASTLKCPVVFFCRNNHFAISTPTQDQYAGDGIGGRASGYGMQAMRCDGNDIFAVNDCMREAKRIALAENRPVMIEAMTYRGGHHSTSDDSTRYRDVEEIDYWAEVDNPINRCRRFMESKGWWDQEKDDQLRESTRQTMLEGFDKAETTHKPAIDQIIRDVYDTPPDLLKEQEAELLAHLKKYPTSYKLGEYADQQ